MARSVGVKPKPGAKVKQRMDSPNPTRFATPPSQSQPPQQNLQWPQQLPTTAPYPEMPPMEDERARMSVIGATGTAIFSGILQTDEYNSDFFWRDGTRIYEQMLRSDAQINAIRQMMELPIRRAPTFIMPGSDDPRDTEIASFVETCLFHDIRYQTSTGLWQQQKWDDILRHILLMLWHGYSTFETCWRVEDGWTKWAQWLPLLPRTVWRWWVGDDNELAGIQQWTFRDYTYVFRNIPAWKLLRFAHRQEGNNFEGISLLRTCYPNWYFKGQFLKIDAIGIERNAIVPPVMSLPPNYTAADIQAAQKIVQNIRANEAAGITIPNTWDLGYPKNQQRYAVQVLPSIQYHDVMIARNILAQFINLGSSETGSYSQDRSQKLTFLNALQSICEYIEDVINNDAIPQLVDRNYDGVEVYPQLRFGKLVAQDLEIMGDTLKSLSQGQQPLLHWSPELEQFLGDMLGIPVSPQNAVTNTNPTAPVTPEQPEVGTPGANVEPSQDNAVPTDAQNQATADAGAAMLSEMREERRLMDEAIRAVDAVAKAENFLNAAKVSAGQTTKPRTPRKPKTTDGSQP